MSHSYTSSKDSPAVVDGILKMMNLLNSTCEVTISFSNTEYLPITATVTPLNCTGNQVASLVLPASIVNGLTSVEW
jgi:hypothetical protein